MCLRFTFLTEQEVISTIIFSLLRTVHGQTNIPTR